MKTVAFDFDGTLIKSIEGIYYLLEYASQINKVENLDKSLIQNYVGTPERTYLPKFLKINNKDIIFENIIINFKKNQVSKGFKLYPIYHGVKDLLDRLYEKIHAVFIVTNKQFKTIKLSIEYFKIDKYFEGLYAKDNSYEIWNRWKESVPRTKSNHLKYLTRKINESKLVFYIRYTLSGFKASKNYFFEFIYASYGFGSTERIDFTHH